MHNFSVWIDETNPIILNYKFTWLLNKSGFKILNKIDHDFNPHGYTLLFLLSESHLAIHTFPEECRSYIELSSCVLGPFKKFINNY